MRDPDFLGAMADCRVDLAAVLACGMRTFATAVLAAAITPSKVKGLAR